jgi:beta-N-acetylhexosaminidase
MKQTEASLDFGQLFMIGLEGFSITPREKTFLKAVKPAGVIYFRRNIESPKQIRGLSNAIQKEIGPALIGIDQEGGRVARLGSPFTVFPGNDFLGRHYMSTGSVKFAQQQAEFMAEELKAIGVNLNFTPVADVDSNPRNPIIGRRAFSRDPGVVAKLVSETIKAYRKAKVACCAKHFPGHGDTFSDSHKALPVVRATKKTLFRREIPPFRAAIQAKVPTIMTAHVIYSALDGKNPATLSKKIMFDLLRKKFGFRGVLISDDLEMNAIARRQSVPDAAVEAISAGVDLLLVCKSLDLAQAVHDRLKKALARGELSQARVQEAIRRVKKLKGQYADLKPNQKQSEMPHRSWKKHQRLAEQIASSGAQNFFVES